MKTVISIYLIILLIGNIGCTQTAPYATYINSFKELADDDVINFGISVQSRDQMTKRQAIEYVYDGDSSKIYCHQKIFNMETEKVEGVSKELYLPSKCFRMDMGNYFIIGYSSYECQNPNELLKISLILTIADRKYKAHDSLVVYRGSDYDADITGFLNPKNGKIFTIGSVKPKAGKLATVYKINPENFKFESIVQKEDVKGSDDLQKTVENLGLKEVFMN